MPVLPRIELHVASTSLSRPCPQRIPPGASRRRLLTDDGQRDVEIAAETVAWLPAQRHAGHNIGDTPTHVIFVELKEGSADTATGAVGPTGI